MNTTSLRCAVVVGLLLLSAACAGSGLTAPMAATQPPALPAPTPTPPAPPSFPPLSGPSRTFIFDHALSYPVSDYTKKSRFVLYDNGAFVLQYPSVGANYRGGYTEANVIDFQWEGTSVAGPWGATGTRKGDSLTVQYNQIMQLTDFEDAVYALTP
jgi:hypothetical protein